MALKLEEMLVSKKQIRYLGRTALLNGYGYQFPMLIPTGATHLIEEQGLNDPAVVFVGVSNGHAESLIKKLQKEFRIKGQFIPIPPNAAKVHYKGYKSNGNEKYEYGIPVFYNHFGDNIG